MIRGGGEVSEGEEGWGDFGEGGVNLTFHLRCVMRAIREEGWRIKVALRSRPLRCQRCVTRKPNSGDNRK